MTVTLEDPVGEALLDALWEAGAKGLVWDAWAWSVLVTDEEVQGVRSGHVGVDGGLETDGIRRLFGDEHPLVGAVAEVQSAMERTTKEKLEFDPTVILATPEGREEFDDEEDEF